MEYLKGVITEMKMVKWPNKASVWESTKVVVAVSLLFVLVVFLYDQFLNETIGFFL